MDQSARLKLPYIIANQAQKHVTHNEAVRMLDCLVQPVVLGRTLASPPASPAEGVAYIVAAGGVGDWAGHDNEIACFADGAWSFFAPAAGWQVFDADSRQLLAFSGTDWAPDEGGSGLRRFGINTEADATNRLAVKSDAVLLSHDDVTPGTGDMRAVLDKADAAKTASVLFQTGFSGRAELGLSGDDDFHVKVSPDGAGWKEALVADRTTGAVKLPQGLVHAETGQALAQLLPCPLVSQIWRSDVARPATPRTYAIGSVSGAGITLATADAPAIFNKGLASMNGACMVRVWNLSKSPAEPAWVVDTDMGATIFVHDAAAIAGWGPGETLQLGDPNPTGANVLNMVAIDISPYMQANFGAVFPQKGLLLATFASGTGGGATISGSGSGAVGSATATASNADGSPQYGLWMLMTTERSPVSNSNLVFMREQLGSASSMGITYMRLVGVYA